MNEVAKKDTKKKVVYLLGTGATQAEVSLTDDTIRILMSDVREEMRNKIVKDEILKNKLSEVINHLSSEYTDVEHLITLYESTAISKHNNIAKDLKQLFLKVVQEKISKLGTPYTPKLLTALIDMHEISDLEEELKGIITLNYEDLLERAIHSSIKNNIDYIIEVKNSHSYFKVKEGPSILLLKLHGSFNWKNEFPITLMDESEIAEEDVLWIPPGVEKRRDRYPFNILWGRARELLDCDILRVIGCALNRNDWQLVSLLYITQQLSTQGREYQIELIDYDDCGDTIRGQYPYLRFVTISEIKEVREYIINSNSLGEKKEEEISKIIKELLSQNPKTNIFDYWLRAKGEVLKKSKNIVTEKKIFENYINEVSS